MPIKVKCPNAACARVYTVKGDAAGKRGKCPGCGAVIAIPDAGTVGPAASRETAVHDASGQTRSIPEPPGGRRRGPDGLREVRVGCIGRGCAGKTALFHALSECLVGGFFPSGLHVDAGDPREVAKLIREGEETQRLLQRTGLPPTLHVSQVRYFVYDGDAPRVAYSMREVIGQVLTHTLPDSSDELQALYDDYLQTLVNTDVLWAVVPCLPPEPDPRDRRRYANDLRITLAYLREALRRRTVDQPVAVILVLSKIDTLFADAAEARAALSDTVLRDALGPLVHLIKTSGRVSDAAIVPVTAFGFGNAVRGEGRWETDEAARVPTDGPFGAEPLWLLRDGAVAEPYNLDTLFLATVLLGLLSQSETRTDRLEEATVKLYRALRDDLAAAGPWVLPIKGDTEPQSQPVAQPVG